MSKAITLTGLKTASKLDGVPDKCTPVTIFSPALDGEISVCKEQLTEVRRRRGRPRGSSPKNIAYKTKKGSRANAPKTPFCPRDKRTWVSITRNGKKEKRCRCNMPGKGGNRRYLKNTECQ